MKTHLYYATVGPLCGFAFTIGNEVLFTRRDDPHIYQVIHLGILTLRLVEESQVEHLNTTIIEPRLRAWAEGA